MSPVVVAARGTGVFVLGSIGLLISTVELVVAGDLIVTGLPSGYGNMALGFAYLALIAVVGFRVVTKRATLGRSVLELLSIDAIALPFMLAAFAM
jgi:hypothetical protein